MIQAMFALDMETQFAYLFKGMTKIGELIGSMPDLIFFPYLPGFHDIQVQTTKQNYYSLAKFGGNDNYPDRDIHNPGENHSPDENHNYDEMRGLIEHELSFLINAGNFEEPLLVVGLTKRVAVMLMFEIKNRFARLKYFLMYLLFYTTPQKDKGTKIAEVHCYATQIIMILKDDETNASVYKITKKILDIIHKQNSEYHQARLMALY